jgi:hypothetical protein
MLADEPGQLAIRSLFLQNAPFVRAVEGMDNSEARSLAALMENEAFFPQGACCPSRRQATHRPELEWLSDLPNCGRHQGGPETGRCCRYGAHRHPDRRGGIGAARSSASAKSPARQHPRPPIICSAPS